MLMLPVLLVPSYKTIITSLFLMRGSLEPTLPSVYAYVSSALLSSSLNPFSCPLVHTDMLSPVSGLG